MATGNISETSVDFNGRFLDVFFDQPTLSTWTAPFTIDSGIEPVITTRYNGMASGIPNAATQPSVNRVYIGPKNRLGVRLNLSASDEEYRIAYGETATIMVSGAWVTDALGNTTSASFGIGLGNTSGITNYSCALLPRSSPCTDPKDFEIVLATGKGSSSDLPIDYPSDVYDGTPLVKQGYWVSESAMGDWPNILNDNFVGGLELNEASGDLDDYFALHEQRILDLCQSKIDGTGVSVTPRGWGEIRPNSYFMLDQEALAPFWTPSGAPLAANIELYEADTTHYISGWYSEQTQAQYNSVVTELFNRTLRKLESGLDPSVSDQIYWYWSTRTNANASFVWSSGDGYRDYRWWQQAILQPWENVENQPYWLRKAPFLTGVMYLNADAGPVSPGIDEIDLRLTFYYSMHMCYREAKSWGKKIYAIIGPGWFLSGTYKPFYTQEEMEAWFNGLLCRGFDGVIIWSSSQNNEDGADGTPQNSNDFQEWVDDVLTPAIRSVFGYTKINRFANTIKSRNNYNETKSFIRYGAGNMIVNDKVAPKITRHDTRNTKVFSRENRSSVFNTKLGINQCATGVERAFYKNHEIYVGSGDLSVYNGGIDDGGDNGTDGGNVDGSFTFKNPTNIGGGNF